MFKRTNYIFPLHVIGLVVCLNVFLASCGLGEGAPESSAAPQGRPLILPQPSVTVAIARPIAQSRSHVISVPLQPDMTVLVSFIHAALQYRNRDQDPSRNPYNLGLEWDSELGCYTVVQAVDVENRSKRKWLITVLSQEFEILYQDRCVPHEDEVILRPYSRVLLTFSRVKDTSRKETNDMSHD